MKGKVLLCHCTEDQECHADVLLDLANGKVKRPEQTSVTVTPYKETADYMKGNKTE